MFPFWRVASESRANSFCWGWTALRVSDCPQNNHLLHPTTHIQNKAHMLPVSTGKIECIKMAVQHGKHKASAADGI